ncbi:alpha/beta fold hydrolase [uncultured Roseobacter sp.]|uniref:alpha/beta fold hydrolase n=1 Tax=uncultured Roseobacter sp. TaxID=114847 RepID=UPI0026138215|nr:alpha/beta hydrolase [uncultured Roseobacter sp.]
MIWVYLILAAIIATPLIIEATRKRMGDKARATAPGQFAQLSQGLTHYQWYGSAGGPVVVCVHGLTTPSFVWQGIAKGLAQMGFHVLVYDLYGRGFSDRPRGLQDRAFFLKQLNDLLEDQGIDNDITLVGYSMGAAIATTFAARTPRRVHELILLAPAGMADLKKGILGFMARTPVIGTWLMLGLYPILLRKGLRAEKGNPTSVPGITDLQDAELNWCGFVPAVRASLAGILSEDLQEEHRLLHREDVPVLAIFGDKDTVIPLSSRDVLQHWNSDAHTAVIAGAGHGLPYSHTVDVLEKINGFVQHRD